MTRAFTVHIVEDDDSLRASIASLLRSVDMAVQPYASAEEFLQTAEPHSPGCLLLDVQLPGSSGVDLQARLKQMGHDMPIVFLTGYGTIPMTVQAMRAGAVEFLTKPFREQDLFAAIQTAMARDDAHRALREQDLGLRQRFASLSPRQKEVLARVAAGRMNKVIAAELGISEITVKVHRRQVMERLEVRTLADLVRAAERLGIEAATGADDAAADAPETGRPGDRP